MFCCLGIAFTLWLETSNLPHPRTVVVLTVVQELEPVAMWRRVGVCGNEQTKGVWIKKRPNQNGIQLLMMMMMTMMNMNMNMNMNMMMMMIWWYDDMMIWWYDDMMIWWYDDMMMNININININTNININININLNQPQANKYCSHSQYICQNVTQRSQSWLKRIWTYSDTRYSEACTQNLKESNGEYPQVGVPCCNTFLYIDKTFDKTILYCLLEQQTVPKGDYQLQNRAQVRAGCLFYSNYPPFRKTCIVHFIAKRSCFLAVFT